MSNAVNTLIAIGGTGARCAEALAHLAAADGIEGPLRLLLVDLDQGNGNLDRARQAISRYQELHEASKGGSLFSCEISLDIWKPSKVLQLNGSGSLPFGAFIGREAASREVGHFLDLFFNQALYGFDITGGCFQHPEIGSIVLRSALRRSLEDEDNALRRFVDQIASDLKSGHEVRVLTAGSVFGGTGASGLPFFPNLFRRELPERWEALRTRADHLHMGGIFLAPYFQWSGQPEVGDAANGPDSNRLSPHAKAVLQHYAKHPPLYEAVYVLGAPHLHQSGDYADRGNRQVNKAHYIELVAALAARDFFQRELEPGTSFLYAESTQGDERQIRKQLGVNWNSLPEGKLPEGKPAPQTRLLNWTLAAVFLESYLLPGLRTGAFTGYPWSRDTVGEKLSVAEDDLITATVQGYRRWLCQVLESISSSANGTDHPSLLPLREDQLRSLGDGEIPEKMEDLPGLLLRGTGNNPDFHEICIQMDKVKPRQVRDKDGGKTALGRLLLTVDLAVAQSLSSKNAKKAVEGWSFGEPAGEREPQSRYLPRVSWEPEIHPLPGRFSMGGSDLLLRIANGLVVGRADIGNSNPISSPWARAYLFETALSNGNPATREAALKTWRGLLGIIAFRRHIGGGGALAGTPLDLETEAVRFAPALAEFVQEAKAYEQRQWLTFYTLNLGGEPIGGTSPLTLFFPAQDLGRSAALLRFVPWFDPERRTLGDPAEHFDRHADLQIYNQYLKSWLDHLMRSGIIDDKVRRGYASDFVRTEIQRWSQSGALARVTPGSNLAFDLEDQSFGDFSLPAIPIQ